MAKSRQKNKRDASAPSSNAGSEATASGSPAHSESPAQSWSKRTRIICSLILLFHITAVFVAPFSGPPPSSIFGRNMGDLFSPYLRMLYIYNGYRFFAPNPGPSHLVRYEVETEAGEKIEGLFPDRDEHWPRLLYHRHFMLSETLFQLNTAIPSEDDFSAQEKEMQELVDRLRAEQHFDLADELAATIEQDRQEYDKLKRRQQLLLDAIGSEISSKHDSDSVRLFIAERPLPFPDIIQEALLDRESGAEPVETRSLPILLADKTRWIEREVWPEEAPAPTEFNSRQTDQNPSTTPPLLQRPPESIDSPPDASKQGRAGE